MRPQPLIAVTDVEARSCGIWLRDPDGYVVVVRHGLVEEVLDDLLQAIAQFDRAIEQDTDGRRAPRRERGAGDGVGGDRGGGEGDGRRFASFRASRSRGQAAP